MKSWFPGSLLLAMTAGQVFAGPVTPVSPIIPTPCVNDSDCVPAGLDYFVTQPGTYFTIAGVPVPLTGVPDPSNYGADTIIQRLQNIDVPNVEGDTETVNTQMLELNLTGVDPSCPQTGGTACNVNISLDPNNPTLGSLTFTQTSNGEGTPEGTFSSFFDVFFDLSFTTSGGVPLPCDANGDTTCLQNLPLTGAGFWTDDNGPYFIVGGQVTESDGSVGVHVADQITPEPGTLLLFGTGLGLVALSRKRRVRG